MSMIAMAHPTPHSAFKRELAWDENRHSDYAPSRPRGDTERIALPSIRQIIPELQLRVLPTERNVQTPSSATSPVGVLGSGVLTSPDYIHSPNQNKRRRLSIKDEREERASQVPRATADLTEAPQLKLRPRQRHDTTDSGTVDGRELSRQPETRHGSFRWGSSAIEAGGAGPHFPLSPYYSYHHPSRVQSLSLGAIHPFDRIPFSPGGGYGSPYQDYMRVGELGGMGTNGDNKQRKRRGNLPKETTDKLRAWFVAHLHHPYPTEDEKQELMRQTGLAMNQISNWFINARRRQLPNMINNARAESDAMASARSADGKVLTSTERGEYDMEVVKRERDSMPLSDGEGSAFDDDVSLEGLKPRRAANMSRGSV
ncbi:homeobox KN domain-containing protein [Bombardia bombarda]|uniref:Homeobox KN domain-containing protein n=1 Tax=Bombardia bombarda TaxID=252184 RepID=A0AA39X9D9_9PEZI|nr:homeobox KN domain-containing protein [Bombardia bombarda]